MLACLHAAVRAAALLLMAASSPAQTLTVDEIVAKNLAARGGAEKLRSINTVKITGTVTAQGMELPMTSWAKRPNRIRRDTKFQDQNIVVAFDGTTVWGVNPMTGSTAPQQIAGPTADLTREEASFDPLFLTYKERGHVVEFVGTESLEGTQAHHLRVTKKNGHVEHHYLNAETGLEMRTVSTVEQSGMKAEVTTELGDYQSVDGMQVAFTMKQSMNGNLMVQVKLQKVEFNVPIEEDFFRMPK
jgi:outer membrane lipoprotein-sorting protein